MEPSWKSGCARRVGPSQWVCVKQRVKILCLQRSGVLLFSEAVTGRVRGDMSEWGPRTSSFRLENPVEGQSGRTLPGSGLCFRVTGYKEERDSYTLVSKKQANRERDSVRLLF